MANEVKRSKSLEQIHSVVYHSSPSLVASGRYLKALRHTQNLLKDEKERVKYEYAINRGLQRHIIFLQEAIINGYNNPKNVKKLNMETVQTIKKLANSDYCVNDGKFSLIDVDGLKKLEMLKKTVLLKNDLVLPCKVKSENNKYKFNTQIIITKNNVLSYASHNLEYTKPLSNDLNYSVLIKVGDGIKNNELLEKAYQKVNSGVR